MPDVERKDVLEVSAAEEQDPVEALSADAADPALGVRPRLRRPHRRLNHPDPHRAEDLVELTAELAVAVRDKEPRIHALVAERSPRRSPAGPDSDADRSTGARRARDASGERLPASRTTSAATPAATAPERTPPEAPDQPASPADERPDAPAPATGAAAAGSRPPS